MLKIVDLTSTESSRSRMRSSQCMASIQIYFEGAKFFPHREEGDEARGPKGRQRGWGSGGGSEPPPHQLEVWGSETESPENLKFGAT